MADTSTLVTLPQLVDLSLNCPEMGSMNVNILHILLHILLKEVNQTDVGVEFHGEDSVRIQNLITASRPRDGFVMNNFEIVSNKKKRASRKSISLSEIKAQSAEERMNETELNVIDQRKVSTIDPASTPPPMKSPPTSQTFAKDKTKSTVVLVDSATKMGEYSVAVTKSNFDLLVSDLDALKTQMRELIDLPGNAGIIEAARTSSTPVIDMFQILNLTKRMDAAETGMEKLGTLFEDFCRNPPADGGETPASGGSEAVSRPQSAGDDKKLGARVATVEQRMKRLDAYVRKSLKKGGGGGGGGGGGAEEAGPSDGEPEAEAELGELEPLPVDAGMNEQLEMIKMELESIREWIEQLRQAPPETGQAEEAAPSEGEALPPVQTGAKVGLTPEMEKKFNECVTKMASLDQCSAKIATLQGQMGTLQKEVGDLLLKINSILPEGDGEDSQRQLYEKLKTLEKEMIEVTETATKLLVDKEERDKNIQAMFEQIDLLKLIKANREDLEDALDDKADACLINRKVSHDQFDAACDDLSKGIEEALEKLSQQEELWKQALYSIQRDVGSKLDKAEVDPLRDFVNNKLKALQDKFKSLTALRKEQEAAGTKSKFLRNVNCISCDKDVVMRKEMDTTLKPQPYALPANRNIAPYLAYELDQLRKQQKCTPNSKNLNFFENAMKQKAGKDKTHICNRYCGGSHTVTTPQQRVTRLGHFLDQWGPEIAPLSDEYVKGNNNHLYKARDDDKLRKMVDKDKNRGSVKEDTVTKDSGPQEQKEMVSVEAQEILQDFVSEEAAAKRQSTSSKHSATSRGSKTS